MWGLCNPNSSSYAHNHDKNPPKDSVLFCLGLGTSAWLGTVLYWNTSPCYIYMNLSTMGTMDLIAVFNATCHTVDSYIFERSKKKPISPGWLAVCANHMTSSTNSHSAVKNEWTRGNRRRQTIWEKIKKKGTRALHWPTLAKKHDTSTSQPMLCCLHLFVI